MDFACACEYNTRHLCAQLYPFRLWLILSDRPINTYNRQGVTKPGLTREDMWAHSIIHMTDTQPFCLPEEEKSLVKKAIAVEKAAEDQKLDPMSRLNYRKVYTIEHNVKVMNVGRVTRDSIPVLLGYWRKSLE
jgi:hypothetical protein